MALGMTIRSVPESSSGAVVHLLAARALRDLGDGFAAILLPVYLLELGFSPLGIGVLATTALLGSALLTFGIGLIGSRHDRQRLLLAGAMLMIATGVAYAVVHDFACFWWSHSPGRSIPRPGASASSFRSSMRFSAMKRPIESRTRLFARYSLIGAMSAAFRGTGCRFPAVSNGCLARQVDGHQGDVRALCCIGGRRLPAIFQDTPAAADSERRHGRGSRAVAAHRLPTGRPVWP